MNEKEDFKWFWSFGFKIFHTPKLGWTIGKPTPKSRVFPTLEDIEYWCYQHQESKERTPREWRMVRHF